MWLLRCYLQLGGKCPLLLLVVSMDVRFLSHQSIFLSKLGKRWLRPLVNFGNIKETLEAEPPKLLADSTSLYAMQCAVSSYHML
jgi:hypothetical protein